MNYRNGIGTCGVGTVVRWNVRQYTTMKKKVNGSVQIAVWTLLACMGMPSFRNYATI